MDKSRILCGYMLVVFLSVVGFCSANNCKITRNNSFADCTNLGLTSIPNDLPRSLTAIDLSNNDISEIINGSFRCLYNLRSIILDNNKIKVLERNAFKDLSNLETLSLNHNLLKSNTAFKPGVFRYLQNLTSINIGNNIGNCPTPQPDRQLYPDNEFKHLRKLKNLTLDLYPLPKFGSGFRVMKSLKILKFDQCCLLKLDNKTFEDIPTNITEIHMTKCYSINVSVEVGSFKHFSNLKVLNLRRTQISLPSALSLLSVFKNKTMDVIDFHCVNSNLILGKTQYAVILTESLFSPVTSICVKKLDIGYNAIVEVHANSLFSWGRHWECVEHIILSGNSFHFVGAVAVQLMLLFALHQTKMNLTTFEYSYAPVEFPDYFQSESKFQLSSINEPEALKANNNNNFINPIVKPEAVYSHHDICLIWERKIHLPQTLQTVRLSHIIAYVYFCNYDFAPNNVQTIDISYTMMENMYFTTKGLGNVTLFDGSGIDFTKTFPNVFQSIPNVKHLVLKDAELDRVFMDVRKQNIFEFITKVENLDISHNHLTDLPHSVLKNMNNLEILNLSFNSLDKFPDHILEKQNLTMVDLSNNRILGLKKEITNILDAKNSKLKGKLTLHLQGNAFLCTCDYMHFIKWLYETQVILDNDNDYICTLSNGTRTTIEAVRTHFHDIFSECQSTFWLIFSIVFVCVCIVILIGSIICYRLRWRIMYFFYRHFYYGYEPIRKNDSTFTYDAFVAYSNAEYQWICFTLREKLEDVHSFRLCLHDRDFEPGLSIQQNIINSICNSRKVIIDATPKYLESKWFEFEIEMANIEMLDRSYENGIIVIIRNGTKPESMPVLLKKLWDRITCILIEDNEDIETCFERLVSALND